VIVSRTICEKLSDEEIISRSLVDLEYFGCLYQRYELQLQFYVSKMSDFSADEIKDIMQNAFIKFWKNINGFDSSMKLSSYLYRVVHNEMISHWRKNQSSEKIGQTWFSDMSTQVNPCEGNENSRSEIDLVLNQMPLKFKEILVLKFLEDMNYKEISNILKIPEGTVATRISKAKKVFLDIVKKQDIDLRKTDFC